MQQVSPQFELRTEQQNQPPLDQRQPVHSHRDRQNPSALKLLGEYLNSSRYCHWRSRLIHQQVADFADDSVCDLKIGWSGEARRDVIWGQTSERSGYQRDHCGLGQDSQPCSLTHESVLPDHSDSRQMYRWCVGSKIVFIKTSLENYLSNIASLDEPLFTGRKGIAYDWQSLLLPSEIAFDASLHALLNAGKDDSATRYA
jgi:hypothetical protein